MESINRQIHNQFRDFNIPLSKQQQNKQTENQQAIENLNKSISYLDSTYTYTILHLTRQSITLLRADGTFTKTDTMQDHRTSIDIFRRTKITQIFSDHNKTKLMGKNTKYKTKHAPK